MIDDIVFLGMVIVAVAATIALAGFFDRLRGV